MNVSSALTLAHQLTLQERLEVATNNVANMTNHGFQEDQVLFTEYVGRADEYERPSYVQNLSTWRNTDVGPIEKTGNPLHVAITGQGYLGVLTPDGQMYTRNGALVIDSQGLLTTPQGYPVLSQEGSSIAIPSNSATITIAADGTISNQEGVFGKIGVFAFKDEYNVKRHRNNLLTPGSEVAPSEKFAVIQGSLEGANVNAMKSTADLISIQRLYAMNQRQIEADIRLEEKAIQQLLTLPSQN